MKSAIAIAITIGLIVGFWFFESGGPMVNAKATPLVYGFGGICFGVGAALAAVILLDAFFGFLGKKAVSQNSTGEQTPHRN